MPHASFTRRLRARIRPKQLFQTPPLAWKQIVFIQSAKGNGSATTIAVSFPRATIAGNFLLAAVGENVAGSITTPTGWTSLVTISGTPSLEVYYLANASSLTSVNWTCGGGCFGVVMAEYQGVVQASPVDINVTSTGSSTSVATGSLSNSAPAEMLAAFLLSLEVQTHVLSAPTVTLSAPTNSFALENQAQANFTSGTIPNLTANAIALGLSDAFKPVVGASSTGLTATSTAGTPSSYATVLLALRTQYQAIDMLLPQESTATQLQSLDVLAAQETLSTGTVDNKFPGDETTTSAALDAPVASDWSSHGNADAWIAESLTARGSNDSAEPTETLLSLRTEAIAPSEVNRGILTDVPCPFDGSASGFASSSQSFELLANARSDGTIALESLRSLFTQSPAPIETVAQSFSNLSTAPLLQDFISTTSAVAPATQDSISTNIAAAAIASESLLLLITDIATGEESLALVQSDQLARSERLANALAAQGLSLETLVAGLRADLAPLESFASTISSFATVTGGLEVLAAESAVASARLEYRAALIVDAPAIWEFLGSPAPTDPSRILDPGLMNRILAASAEARVLMPSGGTKVLTPTKSSRIIILPTQNRTL